jgi:hypothetical protein
MRSYCEGNGHGEISGLRLKMGLTGGSGLTDGVHTSVRERGNGGYRFGFFLGLRADFLSGPYRFPEVQF